MVQNMKWQGKMATGWMFTKNEQFHNKLEENTIEEFPDT